ncbi:MAG: flagellar assembly protein FliH, partial [Lachnospiraceae bacterium]|nr:flagellar assembly protein FliH [Lachnospiraceae bacterium]
VHVSRDDHEYVSSNKDELLSDVSASANVEIIEDSTLKEGNCFIETDGGIYDCSIGTELELLKKELKILSYGS